MVILGTGPLTVGGLAAVALVDMGLMIAGEVEVDLSGVVSVFGGSAEIEGEWGGGDDSERSGVEIRRGEGCDVWRLEMVWD